ncbi:hypothetical protein N9937_02375 [bacterium]|nr:hypothetical protein [bacterium]
MAAPNNPFRPNPNAPSSIPWIRNIQTQAARANAPTAQEIQLEQQNKLIQSQRIANLRRSSGAPAITPIFQGAEIGNTFGQAEPSPALVNLQTLGG